MDTIMLSLTRRQLLASANGFGLVALSSILSERTGAVTHHKPRATSVIFLFMDGGVSHVDSFDPKPKLAELDSKPFTESKNPTANVNRQWLKSPWQFRQRGQCAMPVSGLFPHIGSIADDICIVRSLKTEAINHDPAHTFMNTGSTVSGRPSMGSWLTYGLGAEADDLPGFVVLTSNGRGGQNQPIAARQWAACPEGQLMASALIGMMQHELPGSLFDHMPLHQARNSGRAKL